ncbi:MAG: aminotransferase [Muribaculaceae bacterium]|nr:aminotransferase [Muribaculaceae bacterium]
MKIDNFKVEEWFNKYEKDAVYDLADTCVESLSIDELLEITGGRDECLKELFSRKLNYGDIHGSDRLKSAICTMYESQNPENITITHGAIGANQLVMLTLVENGDKVVSVVPTYQQHYSIPKSFGGDVKMFFLKEENNWIPDLAELRKIVGHDTKLICINNPNNPTGAVIPDEMMREIVEIAKNSGAYILCDEVYRGLNHEGNPFSVSVADIYEKGVSTGSMSKVFSLAGLRLGWIAADKEIIDRINHQREYNTISVGILDDYFAAIAVENKSKIIKRNLEKIKIGKEILVSWANSEPKVNLVVPNGGTTAFVKYDSPILSRELCAKLQEETGVMILPGETLEVEGYLRIGYANNFENLKKALAIFSEWLNR